MRVSLTRLIVSFWATAALTSCMSPQMAIRSRYPQLNVTGPYAGQLSEGEISEMVSVAQQHPEMLKPINTIDMETPDRAQVTGGLAVSETQTVLKLQKKNGKWTIIKGSFYHPRVVITA